MIILGIETSCDETSLCLLETKEFTIDKEKVTKYKILAHTINSQIDIHKQYGGVYPALAKREHIKNLPILFKKIIDETGIKHTDINVIAVTNGPGLEPALWSGIVFAKELGVKHNIPIIPVNHMEGHIVSSLLQNTNINDDFLELKKVNFPSLSLLISGGHTELIHVEDIGKYKILGQTRDDAVGEAFDKVARMLSLPYPGGPEISKLADIARKNIENKKAEGKTVGKKVENQDDVKLNRLENLKLTRPMLHSKDLDFSFAGLKTSILYLLKEKGELSDVEKSELAREFEDTVTDVLISKTKKALDNDEYSSLILGGGVVANRHIRDSFIKLAKEYNIDLNIPPLGVTGDNALMIALVGALRYKELLKYDDIKAFGNLKLE
jgi:N6-L-threonylcarbamoyladenine synthase